MKKLKELKAACDFFLKYSPDRSERTENELLLYLKLAEVSAIIGAMQNLFMLISEDGTTISDLSEISGCANANKGFDYCEKHCNRYHDCYTIALANDIFKEYEHMQYINSEADKDDTSIN